MCKEFKYYIKFSENCPKCLENYGTYKDICYKLVKSKEYTSSDFIPPCREYFEDKYDKNCENKFCQDCGISVESSLEDIKRKREKFKNLGEYIICTKIGENGVAFKTSNKRFPNHKTLFIYEGIKEEKIFELLDGE